MIHSTSLLFALAALRSGNTYRTEKLRWMLESKQVFESIGCMVRKCRANKGTSLIDLVGEENGRAKYSQAAFHPSGPVVSPLLHSDLPLLPFKQDPSHSTG